MGRAQRNPSSRDPSPRRESDGFRLWLYPSCGLASGAQEFVERIDALDQVLGRVWSRRDPAPDRRRPGGIVFEACDHVHLQLRHQVAHRGDVELERHERIAQQARGLVDLVAERSEEHTSELQSLMRSSYAVFCLKKKK